MYEAKALLGKIKKLDCTCSHFCSLLKTPIGAACCTASSSPASGFNVVLRRSQSGAKHAQKQRQEEFRASPTWFDKVRYQPLRKRIPWHSGRITIETVTNETERHAHGAMKSREKRMRKPRSVKLSAPRPKLQRMTSRISGQMRITTMLDKYGVLASLTLQHDQVRRRVRAACRCAARAACLGVMFRATRS